jgi:hypothetical protein
MGGKVIFIQGIRNDKKADKILYRGASKYVLSPTIIRVIKSRRLRWTGLAARMGAVRSA